MSLMLDDIALLYPDQLVLEFSSQQRDRAWEETATFQYQDASSRWRAFLNALCAKVMINYFQTDENFRQSKLKMTPNSDEFPQLWQLINGLAITLNETRLIMIPSEEIEAEELRVHQEWLDLPEWVGNYYLAAHIDLENSFLRVSGFASYEELSQQGHYDPIDKSYALETINLTEDLSTMWVTQELSTQSLPQVNALPELSSVEAATLMQSLESDRPNLLRLALPFPKWGALFTNPMCRKILYNYSQEKHQLEHLLVREPQPPQQVNLQQWFQNIFEAGWRSLEEFIEPQGMNLAYGFRSQESQEEVAKGIKLLDLNPKSENEVALIVKISPKTDEKITVRIQLQSMEEGSYLPSNIKLSLLSASNKTIQEVQARNQDHLIQLKELTCKEGISMSVQITLGDLTLTESFKVGIP